MERQGRPEGSEILTHVEFRSDLFPPYEGEDKEINPGIYGKRFAEFIRDGLRGEGVESSDPFAEDWGWVVSIRNDGFHLWIGCGNTEDETDRFLCFIEPHRPVIRRFLCFGAINTSAQVTALQQAIDDVLRADPAVSDVQWRSHEEFHAR